MIIRKNIYNVDYTLLIPSEPVSHYINYITDIKGSPTASVARIMPEIKMDLAFNFADSPELKPSGIRNSFKHKRSYISGIIPDYVDYKINSNYHICSISIKPEMQYALFGFMPNEITNEFVETDLCIKSCNEVWHKLIETKNAIDRLNILNSWIFDIIVTDKYTPNLLAQEIRNKIDNNLNVSILTLQNELNYSRKHLFSNFKNSLGISIKSYQEIMRFKEAMDKIQINPDTNLVDIAHTLKYFDQSHFIHSFKKYSGLTPKQYANNCHDQFKNVFY